MKVKPLKRKLNKARARQHIVQEKTTLMRERIQEIRSLLRGYYGGLERIYAFACNEKNLKKACYSKRAKAYQRTTDDEQRLQWTVENMQKQITKLQQELFQLMGGISHE